MEEVKDKLYSQHLLFGSLWFGKYEYESVLLFLFDK